MQAVSGARSTRVPPHGSAPQTISASLYDARRVSPDAVRERQRPSQPIMCDACRQRRTGCTFEFSAPVCLQCLNRGTKCVVSSSNFVKRPKADSMKRTQYVRRLQTRLKQMEDLLRSAGIDPGEDGLDAKLAEDDEAPSSDDEDSRIRHNEENEMASPQTDSTPNSSTSPQSSISKDNSTSSIVFLQSDSGAEPLYYGNSSSFYILSQDGIQFIREKTGEADWPKELFSQPAWTKPPNFWRSDIFADLFACQVYRALPPRSEVFSLLNIYFRTINRIFPIFHEDTFMHMVEWQYTQQDCTDVGRWASINALLALSYRYRHLHSSRPEKDTEKAWIYWKNAAAVLTELFLRRNDLLGVQTLLAMAIFARVSGGTREALPLITAAIQSADALGLHRQNSRPDLSPTEQETRNRVWWCAFFLDQTVSIQTGLGNMQSADEFDIELPSNDLAGPEGSGDWCIQWFRTTCAHALLRRKIYGELYSTKAFYKSAAEVRETVDALNIELEEWAKNNPYLEYVPPDSQTLDREQELELIAKCSHILAYRHSLALINRMPLLHEAAFWKRTRPDADPMKLLSARSFKYSLICVSAARDSLKLLRGLPWRDLGYTWCLVDYIFVATLLVFSQVLRSPLNPESGSIEENLELLTTATTYFKTLAPQGEGSKSAWFMASMSAIMERTARKVIDKASKEAHTELISTEQSPPVKTEECNTDTQVPPVDGLPSVQPSGYFVPGDSQNEFDASEMFLQADLTKLMPPLEAQTATPYAWMVPDMFVPAISTNPGGESGATMSYLGMPFTGDYFGQANLGILPGGDADQQRADGAPMPGELLYGGMWNNMR